MGVMEPEFDWSLGEDTVGVTETTSVGERGAQPAEANGLNIQAAFESQSEGEGEGDGGDAGSQQRDALGRFASQEAAGAQVAEAEGDGAEGEADESGDELLLGKFRSVDDLAKSYSDLEKKLGAAAHIEVGELQRQLDEMRGMLQAYQQQTQQPQQNQQQPITDDLVSQVDELAMSNPHGAAQWALENQPLLYNRVMQIWAANDPLAASRYENALMREQLKAEMEETFTTKYGTVAETVTEATQQAQFDTAFRNVAQKHPDLSTFANEMMDAAAAAPELANALMSGDLASKERLIDNLYWLAKGRQADNIAVAATDLGRKQQQQAVAEKQAAAVASGSSSQSRGEKTTIEAWKEGFLAAPTTSVAQGFKPA